jgi:cyanophycin synthetase
MKILESRVYVGPSLYAHFPVIQMLLDLGELEEWPTGRLGEEFVDGLLAALPGLHEHGCSYREPGGFVRRLREGDGTWLGHVLEHVALELQHVAGNRVTFGRTRSTDVPGVYTVVYQYVQRDVGKAAGRFALDLLHSLLPAELRADDDLPEDWDFERERARMVRWSQRRALGPSTASLVHAAEARGIPWLRLNEYSLVQFGHGCHQKRIQATITSETRHIAVEIASDKEETNSLLAALGLPVPHQRLVRSAREAVRAAERMGYPVVVKPFNANHGRGVSIGVETTSQTEAAFEHAAKHSSSVLVESFIRGFDHRMLVINGELIAVAKRVPAHIVGDGKQSIEALVAAANEDPRRGIGHEKVLTQIEFNHQSDKLLDELGYTRATVPPEGETVYLCATANLSTGGTAIDVTDLVHADNREMAVRAAQAIGLDVAGIDFLTDDITESYRDTGGAICEVNAAPGFRMHVAPSEGQSRDAGGAVLDLLFPPGAPSRIPIASITGTNGKTTTSRMLAHILKLTGQRVGLTSTDGVYVDGQLTVKGDMTGPVASRMVLRDPGVDAAVLETARGGLLRAGLGYRNCDVACCLNVAEDHLGLRGIDTLEQLAEVKRIPIEVATEAVVLNADDQHCLRMAAYAEAEHICYVTMSRDHTLVLEHIRAGGRAVALEEGLNGHMITLYDGTAHMPLLWTHLVPATMEGRAMHNVQNAMFAAAMAYSMGVSLDNIRQGLRTFDTTFFQAPGRMNVFDEHPFKVILDYGHNAAAVGAMCGLASRLECGGRRIAVLAAPGDRRDEDIRNIATIAAPHFDHFVCKRDDNTRGRDGDEVPALLADSLRAAGIADAAIEVIPAEAEAINHALSAGRPGDLILIFADDLTRSWKQIVHFEADADMLPSEPGTVPPVALTEAPPEVIGDDDELIRDERGVRLARIDEESD